MPRMGQPTLLKICGRMTEVVSKFVRFRVAKARAGRPRFAGVGLRAALARFMVIWLWKS